MIVHPREYDRRKEAIFAAVARATGLRPRALPVIGLSFRPLPESRARAAEALARAKRQPKNPVMRRLKHLLIWAQYNWSRRFFARHPGAVALCWNGLTGSRRAFMEGARDAGARRLFAELAPLPGRITLDPAGVNAENSMPRDPAFYTDWARGQAGLALQDWRRLGAGMTARPSRRADVGQRAAGDLSAAPFLFVPLQVPDDSQIRLFSGWTGGLEGFLAALGEAARALPEGWQIRVKEHPSARASLAGPVAAARDASGGRIVLDNDTDTFAQVAASRGVLTINSSVGLQAFFHDRPVIVAGEAFFAIPGLVTVADSAEALRTALAGAEGLAFDGLLRDAFMSWLDRVYYPPLTETEAGFALPAEAVRTLLATKPA